MRLTLHTETFIDSCHRLDGYNGKCKNLHGHTWKIECWFRGDSSLKDKVGILVDFGIVKKIHDKLDHLNLNDILGYNPTAENLTEWIYKNIKKNIDKKIKLKVRVYETAVGKETYCEGGDF